MKDWKKMKRHRRGRKMHNGCQFRKKKSTGGGRRGRGWREGVNLISLITATMATIKLIITIIIIIVVVVVVVVAVAVVIIVLVLVLVVVAIVST